MAFSLDGKRLASAGWDKTVRIWDMGNPKTEPLVLHGHEKEVFSVAFSSDGTKLASASVDKTVRVWDMNEERLIEIACSVAGRNLSCEEWKQFLGDEAYSPICPAFPYPKDCS